MKKTDKYSFSVSTLIGLFFALQSPAQENSVFLNVPGKLITYTNSYAPDKVYLQTDKDYYTNGETIWFKAYVLNGITHLPSKKK